MENQEENALNFIVAAAREYVESMEATPALAMTTFINQHHMTLSSTINELQSLRQQVSDLKARIEYRDVQVENPA